MTKVSEAQRRANANLGRVDEGKSDLLSRLLYRTEDQRLLVAFPKHHGVVSKGPIDLTHLDLYPSLTKAFAFGYVIHCLGIEADRRYYLNQQLRAGFLTFLSDTNQMNIKIGEITEGILKQFKSWLDDKDSIGWSASESTRGLKIQEVQIILRQLLADKKWSVELSPDLKLLSNPYPEAKNNIKHTDVLNDAEYEQLIVAAGEDCEQIQKHFETLQGRLADLLAAGGCRSPEDINSDALRCAAFLVHQFGDRPPGWEVITRKLAWKNNISREVYDEAISVLFPDLDELLPFVLQIALFYAFNPGVVLNMEQSNYGVISFAGRERIRLFPYKPRKHGRHCASFVATEDYDNPHRILSFLEKRTLRIRRIVRKVEFADRVFIRYSWATRAGIPLEMSDAAWREALGRFCSRHNLTYFTLEQVRPTTLDLVHEITGGNLLSTQQFAAQASPDTTMQFYTSAAMLGREEERLATGMNQMWRSVSTKGKVDATERDRLNADLYSATPGFGCVDPYTSPIEGERSGVLCEAYGKCPICEHCLIDLSSPHAYAYQRELLRQIDAAQATLGPPWLVRWAPVKEKLVTRCLAAFSREVIVASSSVSIPSLPPVD